jgi:hypothetical protein
MDRKKSHWLALGMGCVGLLFVLDRAPNATVTGQESRQPFASSIEQRQQTVEELRKLNALVQKQIELLSSGKVRVIVVQDKAEGGKRKAE